MMIPIYNELTKVRIELLHTVKVSQTMFSICKELTRIQMLQMTSVLYLYSEPPHDSHTSHSQLSLTHLIIHHHRSDLFRN